MNRVTHSTKESLNFNQGCTRVLSGVHAALYQAQEYTWIFVQCSESQTVQRAQIPCCIEQEVLKNREHLQAYYKSITALFRDAPKEHTASLAMFYLCIRFQTMSVHCYHSRLKGVVQNKPKNACQVHQKITMCNSRVVYQKCAQTPRVSQQYMTIHQKQRREHCALCTKAHSRLAIQCQKESAYPVQCSQALPSTTRCGQIPRYTWHGHFTKMGMVASNGQKHSMRRTDDKNVAEQCHVQQCTWISVIMKWTWVATLESSHTMCRNAHSSRAVSSPC